VGADGRQLAADDTIELAVQVNGKLRGRLMVAPNIEEKDALAAALADPTVAKFVSGQVRKVIFRAGRLINIVV